MNENVYSLLLDLLARDPERTAPGLFGAIAGASPLAVSIRGTTVRQGLFCPRGTRFTHEDIGREVALLPCEEGFLVLCEVEEAGKA